MRVVSVFMIWKEWLQYPGTAMVDAVVVPTSVELVVVLCFNDYLLM